LYGLIQAFLLNTLARLTYGGMWIVVLGGYNMTAMFGWAKSNIDFWSIKRLLTVSKTVTG
jgi:hypothetical protein